MKLSPTEYFVKYNHGKIILDRNIKYTSGSVEEKVKILGEYQSYIIDWAKKVNPPGATIIDVGANIGVHSIGFSKITPKVISFEPVPLTKHNLERNILANKVTNIQIEEYGLSSVPKQQTIYVYPNNLGASSVHTEILYKKGATGLEFVIQMKTLDEFDFKNIGFIKVDIQGGEYNFLLGAHKTLKREKPALVLELPIRNDAEKTECSKCTKLLGKNGYKLAERYNKDCLFLPEERIKSYKPLFRDKLKRKIKKAQKTKIESKKKIK